MGDDSMGAVAAESHRDRHWAGARLEWLLLFLAVVAVTAFRAWHCLQPPANTGDVVRHIAYGLLVGQRGLAWAAVPLTAVNRGYAWIAWSGLPYNYPVVALGFFVGVAAISPTVLAVKVALTAIEGVNALLVARVTRSRWVGVLYWAYPVSIWWVSREAQFEPLQTLFALAALVALRRSPAAACALLGLAVQTKLTAGLLLPLFLARAARGGIRPLLGAGGAFVASFLPTALSLLAYPSVAQLVRYSAPLRYNPYYWNPSQAAMFSWNPTWLVAADQIASYALIVGLAVALVRSSAGRLAYAAPLAFAVVLKLHTNVQFWYWLTMPVFLVAIPDRRVRTAALILLPLVDVYSIAQLAFGPFGSTVGDYYRFMQ